MIYPERLAAWLRLAMDFYARLGLPRDANAEEIRSAYRRLSLQHHPDSARRDNTEEFLRIHEAYETLSDRRRRSAYDRQLRQAEQKARRRPVSVRTTGVAGHPHLRRSPVVDTTHLRSGSDGEQRVAGPAIEVLLSPSEAFTGGRMRVEVPVPMPCEVCGGSGAAGAGVCGWCGGSGALRGSELVDVIIPARVRDGTRFPINLRNPAGSAVRLNLVIRVVGW